MFSMKALRAPWQEAQAVLWERMYSCNLCVFSVRFWLSCSIFPLAKETEYFEDECFVNNNHRKEGVLWEVMSINSLAIHCSQSHLPGRERPALKYT